MRTVLSLLMFAGAAWGQYVSVETGLVFSPTRTAAASNSTAVHPASEDFSTGGVLAIDGGIPVFPFLTGAVHYSYSRPELNLYRGDALNSSAKLEVAEHSFTLEAHARTPEFAKWRGFGFAGVGFTRFSPTVESQTGSPFPGGAGTATEPVITIGGGVERKWLPLLSFKLEIRDYAGPMPSLFYQPGGTLSRLAVMAGVVLGK